MRLVGEASNRTVNLEFVQFVILENSHDSKPGDVRVLKTLRNAGPVEELFLTMAYTMYLQQSPMRQELKC